jgi:hypothetical protein
MRNANSGYATHPFRKDEPMPTDRNRTPDLENLTQREGELRQAMSDLAAKIADTEGQVAATRRTLAADHPDRADEHLAAATRADRFAAHERVEERRWNVAEEDHVDP